MRWHWFARALKIVTLVVVVLTVLGFVVMSLWNALVPELFGGPTLKFWQALGLLLLSRILVGGFKGHGAHGHWRHRMRERWERMTPEERMRFRQGWKHRCMPWEGRTQDDQAKEPPQ
jgi:Ca2+/H+ antiporter, TMEM165/GDT1 family